MLPDPEPAAPRAELPMRLTRLRVKNFRSIADIDIPLSPLTVLVGPNGSGKSNVVDALRFVRDVFARGLDQAVMDRDGIEVIQRWETDKLEITLGLTIECEARKTDSLTILDLWGMDVPCATVDYEFSFSRFLTDVLTIDEESLTIIIHEKEVPELRLVRKGQKFNGEFGITQSGFEVVTMEEAMHDLWLPAQLFRQGISLFVSDKDGYDTDTRRKHFSYSYTLVESLANLINSFVFYTLNPTDLRQPQQVLKQTPFDERGRNLAAVLRRLSYNDSKDWNALRFALHRAVEGFDTIEIEKVGGYLATKLIYQTDTTQPRTSYIGQESDGTIRMLGLLAALYQDPAQPFLSIEEPEANIHPGALAVLASVLDEASLRSQVLVTTHSPDMLDHLPAESFLVVEKVGDTTHVGPLDASQLASVRKRLFTPGELLRMEGLQRQADPETPAA